MVRLYELQLREQSDEALGPRPADADGAADWEQRKLQGDLDLERTLEQERLRQVITNTDTLLTLISKQP